MTLSTKVYTKLLQVPEGKVTTYGDLAKAVRLKIAKDRKEITNKEFWELYKKIGGNTVRNIAHLRTLIEEITSKQKDQK